MILVCIFREHVHYVLDIKSSILHMPVRFGFCRKKLISGVRIFQTFHNNEMDIVYNDWFYTEKHLQIIINKVQLNTNELFYIKLFFTLIHSNSTLLEKSVL